jgi:hypothetical protein
VKYLGCSKRPYYEIGDLVMFDGNIGIVIDYKNYVEEYTLYKVILSCKTIYCKTYELEHAES